MPTKVITGEVRFSYANVWTPTAIDDESEPKYNVSLLIPKKDKKTVKAINDAIEAETELLLEKLGVDKLPKGAKIAELRDGDDEYPGDPTMEGMWFIRVSSKSKPGIVEKDPESGKVQEIINPDEFYSGCYGKASINAYWYAPDKKPFKGVTLGLNNLMKTKDGDHLGGGRASAMDDFGDDDDLY